METVTIVPSFLIKLGALLSVILLFLMIYYLINIGNEHVARNKKITYNSKLIIKVILGLFALYIISYIFGRYKLIADTFFTIVFSIILAYLLNPLVNYFETKGLKRTWATGVVYLIIFTAIVILTVAVLPRTGRELSKFASNLPTYIATSTEWIQNKYNELTGGVENFPEIFTTIQNAINKNLSQIGNNISNNINVLLSAFVGTLSRIVSWVLMPIVTFYLLVDKDTFIGKLKSLIPKDKEKEILKLGTDIDNALSQFIRGRLLMALFVGIVTTIFLFIMRVEFAIVIGFITMIADIIPYIGPFIGFVPAVIFAFVSGGPIKALWIGLFFILIQWVENNIVAPKILGKTTGMHPLTVLISIIVGGTIFGVLGMILAVPFVSIAIILFRYFREKQTRRSALKASEYNKDELAASNNTKR